MLRGTERKKALASLEKVRAEYQDQEIAFRDNVMSLYEHRKKCAEELITKVEAYINSMKNTPIELDKSFSELRIEIREFDNTVHQLERDYQTSHVGKGTAAAGVLTGAGVATLAPTAAMAIATTFGTASTGTAISTLSGAAATKAALAWLGGGALAAGGGGMSAGSALLGLAGPVGWGIGAAGIIGGTLLARRKNGKIIEQAKQEEKILLAHLSKLTVIDINVQQLLDLTKEHYEGVELITNHLAATAPKDYQEFNNEQKDKLGALINHIHSLSALINKKIDENEK